MHSTLSAGAGDAGAAQFALAQQALGFVTWLWDVGTGRARWFGDIAPLLGRAAGAFDGSFEDYLASVHPADTAAARRTLRECLKGARPEYRTEERVVRPDGQVRWLETYGRGEYGADGRARALMGVVHDVTSRKLAEEARVESERRYRSLFESALDCIMVVGPDGTLLDMNSQGCRTLGYSKDELRGGSFRRILDAPALARLLPRPAGVAPERRSVRAEHTLARSDGSTCTVEFVAGPLPDGNLLVVVRDVSERARAEARIRELNESLERRVRERTAALESAIRELESFSSSVSHDLRAPARAIVSHAVFMREDAEGPLPEPVERYRARIEAGARRMGKMIDDLLALSYAGCGELRRETVDMRALVEEVLAMLRAADASPAEVAIGELPPAKADPSLIRQVWQNLLGNALKFSRGRQRPDIEVGGSLEGSEARYWVRDNGAGFDMRYAGRLFGAFQRLHGESEFPGTGVGLALCKRVLDRHGGRIEAESAPDAGATFRFSLPA